MASRTVYSWVAGPTDLSSKPTTQPALRAWGDAIMELRAARLGLQTEPPVSIRSTAIFAWMDPLPPENLARITAERRRVQLEVDPDRCAVARVDLVDAAFDAATWRALAEHLTDRGVDREVLEEELVVLVDPLANVLIDRAAAAVAATDSEILDAVISYFAPIVDPYLDSWAAFSGTEPGGGGSWEIVIAPDAVHRVRES